jgi:hypothetical protein
VDDRDTIRRLKAAVAGGNIPSVLKIYWARTLLPKHRVGNPGVKGAFLGRRRNALVPALDNGTDADEYSRRIGERSPARFG